MSINDGDTTAEDSIWFEFSGTPASDVDHFVCDLDGTITDPCTSPLDITSLSDGSHTFTVAAVDAVGNADATPATFTWIVDTAAPDTTITAHTVPSGGGGTSINDGDTTAEDSIWFEFSGTPASDVDHFVCDLDGTITDPCTSPLDITSLSDGSHTFTVAAVDAVGNADATPATFTWIVDTAAPDTTITAHTVPSGGGGTSINDGDTTAEDSIRFEFSGTPASDVDHFVCDLDGTITDPCTSPLDITSLSDGSHTFTVAAVDAVGNADATPATFTWIVDTAAPDTTITAHTVPSGGGGTSINDGDTTAEDSIWFEFSGTPASDVDHFVCDLDGTITDPCTSPLDITSLSDGSHTFTVAAVDAVGNADATPATFTWIVDTAAPDTTITAHTVPSGGGGTSINDGDTTAEDSIRFEFSGTPASDVDHFVCDLDGTITDPCTSPLDITSLSDGSHTFTVAAVDAVGNADATPATFTWIVDTAAPDTTITAHTVPSGGGGTSINDGDTTAEDSIRFEFSGTPASDVDHFVCDLDGTITDPCTSPLDITSLSDGSHTFTVAGAVCRLMTVTLQQRIQLGLKSQVLLPQM